MVKSFHRRSSFIRHILDCDFHLLWFQCNVPYITQPFISCPSFVGPHGYTWNKCSCSWWRYLSKLLCLLLPTNDTENLLGIGRLFEKRGPSERKLSCGGTSLHLQLLLHVRSSLAIIDHLNRGLFVGVYSSC